MDDLIYLILAYVAYFVFRQLGSRKQAGPRKIPPLPGNTGTSGATETAPPARSTGGELEQALAEIKSALGLESKPAMHRDVEAFPMSEQNFENEAPFRGPSQGSEDLFEQREAYSIPASDSEEQFESKSAFASEGTFYDEGFENKPMSSEVDFSGRWKGHDSDFEYHSALTPRPSRPAPEKESESAPKRESSRLSTKLTNLSPLQRAVVLHEIVGAPISLRNRPARRRLS